MNTIHTLDNREQVIPFDFADININNVHVIQMESGDYLTARKEMIQNQLCLVGHLAENKRKDFDIQNTDTMEQFSKELYQMDLFRAKHPHVQLHAIWYYPGIWKDPIRVKTDGTRINVIRVFTELCEDYDVRSHVVGRVDALETIYEKMELPSSYRKYRPYISRARKIPTFMAREFRQIDQITPEVAIDLAYLPEFQSWSTAFESHLSFAAECALHEYFGDKVDGEPMKITLDVIRALEEGI